MSNSQKSGQQGVSAPPLFNWLEHRAAGLLLHPTCFPSHQGIGVLNSAVDALFGFMKAAGLRYWQICPLGPTGFGDSPYQCFSAFAGNPYLVDVRALLDHGLLEADDLRPLESLPRDRVDYGGLWGAKWPVLNRAYERFKGRSESAPYGSFDEFRQRHADWLEPFVLFLALKDHFNGQPWWEWPQDLRFYAGARKTKVANDVADRARAHAFFQYLFYGQWNQVREKARQNGIEIVGDAPIFVARDSADVWAHPELFLLDRKTGQPLFVAGVPPDYFSATGQLWGNPLYDWPAHAKDGYRWWIQRLAANLELYDVVRIDHFRGFDTYWAIPADAPTAKTGRWEKGPGLAFFEAVKKALPECRLIAEDLGELMPSVLELRDATGLPGMAILQFAFGGGGDNLYLPHNLRANSVVYPGTHDNDTTVGWYAAADQKTQDHVRRYFRISGAEISWDFIRTSYASVSNLAVIPFQDFLNLDSRARFNTPGAPVDNWQWRYHPEQLAKLHRDSAAYLRDLGELYYRPTQPTK
jgi:4-alpha-glucanotransferase